MTARKPLVSAAVLLLFAAAPRASAVAEETAQPGPSASEARVAPAAPDMDLRQIRDIFRYADEPRVDDGPGRAMARPAVTGPAEAPPPAPRARLVGLVERGGRQAAALSIDGEVVVLGEGESSGGFTVLGVGDERVRLRSPGGDEETLRLP